MPMPNRNIEGNYRYGYQGEFAEKEKEIGEGRNSFQLRLWDSRIGRWLTTDPYGQFASPYVGMGNNPVAFVDPDGGFCEDTNGNQIPCPDGYGHFDGPTEQTGLFWDGEYAGLKSSLVTINASRYPAPPNGLANSNNNIQGSINYNGVLELALNGVENFGGTSNFKLYGAAFTGDMYKTATVNVNWVNGAKVIGNLKLGYDVGKDVYKAATNEGQKRDDAITGLATTGVVAGATRLYPPIGVIYTGATIIKETETWKQAVHDARQENIRKRLENGEYGLTDLPKNLEFRQGQ
ncbi:hypothetical protein EM932_20450 [Flavivirga rizhaonensis]|uniref:RHS repeat-associated core domain-containing protein n=1 Tax=Flavivirga rizhaonensis TaxID=2559571 RepID=A0A4S1DQW7_9FLAO|nr:hypothetical protein EM932_20450 [Flavivirga rizhaonensis]